MRTSGHGLPAAARRPDHTWDVETPAGAVAAAAVGAGAVAATGRGVVGVPAELGLASPEPMAPRPMMSPITRPVTTAPDPFDTSTSPGWIRPAQGSVIMYPCQ